MYLLFQSGPVDDHIYEKDRNAFESGSSYPAETTDDYMCGKVGE